jgi:hypothetical protein
MFKTELHAHSSEVSFCSSVSARDVAEKYIGAGYSTVVLSNHFEYSTMSRREESYSDFVLRHAAACDALRDAALGRLNVIFGAELRFRSAINDYLLYGATPEFLLAHPDVFDMTPSEFSTIARDAGVLFVQAHPFRNGMVVINPAYLDGVEIFNGSPGHNSRNDVAEMWAKKHSLIPTSGSDFHHVHDTPNAGILTECEIKTAAELVSILRDGKYELIR